MSAAPPPPSGNGRFREGYLGIEYSLKSWLLTTDHKRIGLLYMASITLFFFLGPRRRICHNASPRAPDTERRPGSG
jgi:hypothetical protein